jgi:hypothetical protein
MKIWYLVANNGDGSCSVDFFRTEEAANSALALEGELETYNCNEGTASSFEVTPTADGELAITGFVFMEDQPAELEHA